MRKQKVTMVTTQTQHGDVWASLPRLLLPASGDTGPLNKLGLEAGWVRTTPTLTSHLSPRQVPKHLSSQTDWWAWDGLVCHQGEGQQLFNSPASDPSQYFQGRKCRRIECPLNTTTKAGGGGSSSPCKQASGLITHTQMRENGSSDKGGEMDQNCSQAILAWPPFPQKTLDLVPLCAAQKESNVKAPAHDLCTNIPSFASFQL